MQFIARAELTGNGSTSIVANNIPDTFDDLLIRYSIRSYRPSGLDPLLFRLNLDSGANYDYKIVYSWNTGDVRKSYDGVATSVFMGWVPARYASANTFGAGTVYIPNYAGSNPKAIGAEAFFETQAVNEVTTSMISGLWSSTAVHTVSFHCGGSEGFGVYSTMDVFGITRNSGSATVS
jgi:hypothetical protein